MISVKVNKITSEATNICSFELIPVNHVLLPSASPGAHIDVHIDHDIVRQYSLINGPNEDHHYVIAVQKELQSRGGSKAMHDSISEGDIITISEPRNNFHLVEDAEHYTLLAGGIGITPILSMARHLSAKASKFTLHYCCQSSSRMAFKNLISESNFSDCSFFHYDDGSEDQLLDLHQFLGNRPDGGHLYLCGPQGFMKAIEAASQQAWPAGTVHMEYFSVDEKAISGNTSSFQIKLAHSGEIFSVPEDRSIVEVLAENNIQIPTSCEQGVCGTCLVGVIDGEPDHRDVFLSEKAKKRCNKLTPCVSRSKTPLLVIDL